ncbi:recombinase family protein [Granulicella sp. S190]|uniref:recombinase family protein n=1 Tax=Granulicella sp. S190 TaxID=1747226 RepID=UPI00131E444D|nr:recombinase family protein [Granulicella sp. S190]
MTKKKQFVAYYRVSTDRQGESGLGLEAQKAAVGRFIGSGSLLAEFQEVESGKRHANRPQLAAALEHARKHGAVLVIAKLDRLARNVAFVANLMESGVEFQAVDMPYANKLTIHILAAVAEHEREAISERTKAALEAAKARGTKLGNPRWKASLSKARAVRSQNKPPHEVIETIKKKRDARLTWRRIAADLNGMGIKSLRGGPWHDTTAKRAVDSSRVA